MRLDFNVLWVDDQPESVEAQIIPITNQMEAEGFDFNPKLTQTLTEVQELIGDPIFANEIDLILVDWDLGGKTEGQDVIAVIREVVRYKDVVFYSAQTPAATLRRLAFEKEIEGVYCANRTGLVDEVVGVFESLVKKVLDLDHMRGIVMGATSDIDNMVNECLAAIHDLNQEGQELILKQTTKYIEEHMADLNKRLTDLSKSPELTKHLEAYMIFTSYDRLSALAGALESEALKPHSKFRSPLVEYQQKVVPERNRLGHAVLRQTGGTRTLTDSKGRAFTFDDAKSLRRKMLGYRTEFRLLRDALRKRVNNGQAGGGSPTLTQSRSLSSSPNARAASGGTAFAT